MGRGKEARTTPATFRVTGELEGFAKMVLATRFATFVWSDVGLGGQDMCVCARVRVRVHVRVRASVYPFMRARVFTCVHARRVWRLYFCQKRRG